MARLSRAQQGLTAAPVITGQKVKVYVGDSRTNRTCRYGEVIGISENDHKLLLAERPEFESLSTHDFHHFRTIYEVNFLEPNKRRIEREEQKAKAVLPDDCASLLQTCADVLAHHKAKETFVTSSGKVATRYTKEVGNG